jgi:hypothetical protein
MQGVARLAEVIFQDRRETEEVVIEAVVYSVEESEEYPEGLRYSFQAHKDGETVLRYDNYNLHSNSRHHKHIGEDETEPLDKTPEDRKDIVKLYKRFLKEVDYQ